MKKFSLLIIIFLNISSPVFAMEKAKKILQQLGTNLNLVQPKIEFSAQNIDKYPQYRDYFINIASDMILGKSLPSADFHYTFFYLLQKYPAFANYFIKKILANWDRSFLFWSSNDQENTFIEFLRYLLFLSDDKQNQEFIEFLLKGIKYSGNSKKILRILVKNLDDKFKKNLSYVVNNLDINNIFLIFDFDTLDELFPYFNAQNQNIMRDYILKNNISDVYPLFTEENIDRYPQYKDEYIKYVYDNFNKLLNGKDQKIIQKLIKKYPEAAATLIDKIKANLFQSNIDLVIAIIDILSRNEKTFEESLNLALNYIKGADNIKLHPGITFQTLSGLNFPFDPKLVNRMKEIILKDPDSFGRSGIELFYSYFLPSEQRKDFKENIKKHFEKYLPKKETFKDYVIASQKIPYFLKRSPKKLTFGTQSKQHFFNMLGYYINVFHLNEEDINFFLKIYAQEKVEESNSNYVFFHGRQWKWNYYSDIYKQLWNLTKNDHVANFEFLRFGQPGPKREENRDILFMNSAIFGNLTNPGSNTAKYWLDNSDQSFSKNLEFLNTEYLFKQFNLENIYKKYEKEFKKLQELHSQASKRGEILLISVSPEKTIEIVPTRSGGGVRPVKIDEEYTEDTKEILDTLKTDPSKIERVDNLEWGLILGTWDENDKYIPSAYSNDPHSGLIIYSFYEADPKIMDQYFKLRDELFAKIKQDLKKQVKKEESGQIRSSL